MRWVVGLYPQWWRQRYGEEFGALLEEGEIGPGELWDILGGAFDAHLLGWRRAARRWKSGDKKGQQDASGLGWPAGVVLAATFCAALAAYLLTEQGIAGERAAMISAVGLIAIIQLALAVWSLLMVKEIRTSIDFGGQ